MIDFGEFARHGGALDAARRLVPDAPQPWIDLSTGINPVAYPFSAVTADAWTRLPEASALDRLEQVARARFGAPAGASVVAAPGTQAIIQRLPALTGGACDVRILGPTYGEFERVFRRADARIRVVPELQALAGADVAVVVNPNNPDGRLSSQADLLHLAARVGRLIVDEAYADALGPAHSLIPRLPIGRGIVLRSFGKIYGLAGVRLGFAVGALECGEALRGMLGPWPVSGPAIRLGEQALADEVWLNSTRDRLRADHVRLGFVLGRVGATAIGATPLFRLISHPVASELFRALAKAGILARPFVDKPHWLRFGLPGSEAQWARLEAALARFR